MPKILIIYYSRSGNTKKMAQLIADGIKKEKIEVVIKKVEDIKAKELLDFEAIMVGSPVYYGGMAAQIKELFDERILLPKTIFICPFSSIYAKFMSCRHLTDYPTPNSRRFA